MTRPFVGSIDAVALAIADARRAQERMQQHELGLDQARADRDKAMRLASELGVSRRALAASMTMTPGRVQQIVGETYRAERKTTVSPETLDQILAAYRAMATEGRYRPKAPSDGFGNITVPIDQLDLEDEAREYAISWSAEEDTGSFYVGLCNFPTRPATIYAIEAARNMCSGMSDDAALRLLRLAVSELEEHLTPAAS